MISKPKNKIKNPNFSSGPTKKPSEWDLTKLNTEFLGRYHRSKRSKEYIDLTLEKLRIALKIPKDYDIIVSPGSCSGAAQSVIWSLFGQNNVTSLIFDLWGKKWSDEIKKLKIKQEIRFDGFGFMPSLENINIRNDIFFVWTGTTSGISFNNLKWIPKNHQGLIFSDITSAVFVYKINWNKLDAAVFSWQKAIGSESQHGIIVLGPKAKERLKNKKKLTIPKLLEIKTNQKIINTPSMLCFSDFDFCLDIYKKNGGLKKANLVSKENSLVLSEWIEKNDFLNFFVKEKKFRAITVSYFKVKDNVKKKLFLEVINYLEKEEIAFDIQSYRNMPLGLRIWTGPTILKNDLINLTNWLDWSFYNFFNTNG